MRADPMPYGGFKDSGLGREVTLTRPTLPTKFRNFADALAEILPP
jgi:hypothetical protein